LTNDDKILIKILRLEKGYTLCLKNATDKGQISTPTAPKPLHWFWWNSNLRTTSWRPPTRQNFLSIRRCRWSRQIPSLPLSLKRQFLVFTFPQVVQKH